MKYRKRNLHFADKSLHKGKYPASGSIMGQMILDVLPLCLCIFILLGIIAKRGQYHTLILL